jgi:hypothetical protein
MPAVHDATVPEVAPGEGHAYPALQLVHDGQPSRLYLPGGHTAPLGVGVVDPGGHAYPALQLVHNV